MKKNYFYYAHYKCSNAFWCLKIVSHSLTFIEIRLINQKPTHPLILNTYNGKSRVRLLTIEEILRIDFTCSIDFPAHQTFW